jgi:hypothetical protein
LKKEPNSHQNPADLPPKEHPPELDCWVRQAPGPKAAVSGYEVLPLVLLLWLLLLLVPG